MLDRKTNELEGGFDQKENQMFCSRCAHAQYLGGSIGSCATVWYTNECSSLLNSIRALAILTNDEGVHDGQLTTKLIVMRVMLSPNLPLTSLKPPSLSPPSETKPMPSAELSSLKPHQRVTSLPVYSFHSSLSSLSSAPSVSQPAAAHSRGYSN